MIQAINTDNVSVFKNRFKDADWLVEPLDIIIGGAGGIGSWLALFISRIGHSIHLFDMDSFEEHNLSGQFVANNTIGLNKAIAVGNMCTTFNGQFDTSIYTYGEYSTTSITGNVVFSCFDNMEARKIMYENWIEHLKANPDERKNSIFIDGRLLAEQFQIFTVPGDNITLIKKYFDYLYTDDEIEVVQCTLKQTSHIAAMIASNMTSIFNNWVANKVLDMPVRATPFYYEHYAPIMYSETQFI